MELATGDYIAFVDNDDYLDPDYLESFVCAAGDGEADIVLGGYRRPDENGRVRTQGSPVPGTEWAPYAVEAAWAKLYRTEFVRRASLEFLPVNISEDLFFTLPATTLSQKSVVIPYCGYNWFLNPDSVSSTVQRKSEGLQFELAINRILARMLGTAMAIREFSDERPMTTSRAFALFLVFLVGLGPKAVYFPMLAILMLMPSSKFESKTQKKRFYIAGVVVALLAVATFALPLLSTKGGGSGDYRGGRGVNASAQTALAFQDPVSFARTMPLYRGYDDDFPGYECNLRAFQDVSAVGLQGLLTSRASFEAVGGFDEAFSDETGAAEYCVRLRETGMDKDRFRAIRHREARLFHEYDAKRESIRREYHDAKGWLTSMGFWKQYLGM